MSDDLNFKSISAKVSGEGTVEAEFSVFNVIDRDGDIVTAGALMPHQGRELPMVWSHDWAQPVGKGRLTVSDKSAIFAGTFLKTARGEEAYETVKQMGELQQWSWGFRTTDHTWEKRDGQSIRVIKGVEPFEVSPVLVGANQYTRTLAVKAHRHDDNGIVTFESADDLHTALKLLQESHNRLCEDDGCEFKKHATHRSQDSRLTGLREFLAAHKGE